MAYGIQAQATFLVGEWTNLSLHSAAMTVAPASHVLLLLSIEE